MNLIWLILSISAVVRIWGINFAVPLRYGHIDESVVIFYTMRFFTGDFNPNPFFDYPTLYLYLLFFCYLLYFIAGFIFGKFESISNFIAFYNSNPVPFILIGRILTVVFSIVTIYFVYIFAKKLFDRKTGLLSALFLSLNWQHILSSHYATTDIAAVFFTLLSAFFVWDIYTKNDLKSYLLAGFFCGLSIATKYYGGIIFLAIVLFGWKNKKYVGFSFLAVITAFFIGCPFAFIDYAGFLSRFFDRLSVIIGLGKAIPFSSISNNFDIFNSLGYFFSLSTIAGFIYLILKHTKQHIFLLIIILIFLLFFGTWQTLPGRYILALYPFFAIISATVISRIKNKYLFSFAIALFLITTLPKIIKTDTLLSQKDTRVVAREWVIENIPGKSKILRGPFCPEFPNDNYITTIDWHDKIKTGGFLEIQKKFDFVITSSLHSDPEIFTKNLGKYGNKIYEISKESAGEFQNPTIKIYKLK
ncbi:MAG: hypothetical protein COS68_05720 [Elusimicrobia bacterium CG06_land_8_20_14_3_00_38_11]|nr:MAG: hypothetical protein COS68_05720 [Elusimicrobia bacterium CG06_land_8_20_14_3_00_38_11]